MKVLTAILIFLFFYQDTQNPYFYEEDVELYKFNDPSFDYSANVDEQFLWNFHNSVTPCYKKVKVNILSENETVLKNSDGTTDRYIIDDFKNVIVRSKSSKDPFFQMPTTAKYKKGFPILRNNLEVKEIWSSRDEVSFTIKRPLNFELNDDYGEFDSIRISARLEVLAKVEAINQLHLPINSRRVTLLSYKKKWKLIGLSQGGGIKWQSILNEYFDKLGVSGLNTITYDWTYVSNTKPFILAELTFDNEYRSTNFDFYHTAIPKTLVFCNAMKSNVFLFPNPSFGKVKLLFENLEFGNYQLIVYNILGDEIDKKHLSISDDQLIDADLSHLNKGTYLYAIIDEKGNRLITKKMVILSL